MFFLLFWGRGWACEAALACLDFGFNVLELPSIIAITQEANQKSCRLLEKIGMNHINNLWHFNANQYLYELTHSEWIAKNREDH
jgi:[ribosomal protein S5]-alanine N-acetyltransferase